jgi:lysophospholipase L1-like esterase
MEKWQKVALGMAMGLGVGIAAVPGYRIIHEIRKSLRDDPEAYREDMERFAREDRKKPPPADVIVFTGSSSITFWKTLKQDMAPLHVLNRGFGGSTLRDVVYWAERAVIAYHPRAVVLFAGTNDLADPNPKTPQAVFEGYLAFVQTVHAALPNVPIYFVGITPTPSRWHYWAAASEANRLIQTYAAADERLRFIDLADKIMGPDGRPERSLYRFDRLHPNKKGYARWISVIKPILMADFGQTTGARETHPIASA